MRYSQYLKGLAISTVVALAFQVDAQAAEKKKKDSKKKEKTVAELIKDKTEFDGLFDLYQDPKTGSTMMVIEESQLDKPILYFTKTVNGVLDAGHFKGAFREYKLLEFNKHFNKIEIVSKTPRYILDESNAISRSAGTNISPAILASLKVEAHDKEQNRYIVKMDSVFLKETLHKVSPYPRPRLPGMPPALPTFKVGGLSKSKTKYKELRSYPKNTDVVVEYVFDNKSPSVRGSQQVTDPRTVVVQMQHSFIELPENGFKARRDDPRIGFFHQQFDDLTSDDWAPYKDVINRWNLVKKDPTAEISEPVEPITWWIENTTPVEWRDTIKKAGEAWNIAFEKAGFKNALVVKVQPDDAEWDSNDIRYNVMRWTSSPRPPFGGYGPSIANPLTGQIIASDIMLEFAFMKNRWLLEGLYTDGATTAEMMPDLPEGLYCSAGHLLHSGLATAKAALAASGVSGDVMGKLVEQSLSYLILHELGHTLGLNHNMKASQLHDATEVHNESATQGVLAGSVMDYPAMNIAPPGVKQGDFATSKPGPYDLWAIEYGYSTALEDNEAEEARLSKILSRSTEKQLAFGNDADDMRSPGLALDPRVMIGDMSSEAVKYSRGRFELVNDIFGKIKTKTVKEGESYQQLLVTTNYLVGEWNRTAGIVSRYIGGIYVDRAMSGQSGETQPFTPVEIETQKAAMAALRDYLFTPDVLKQATPVFAYLQAQRRGFNHFGRNEDPKLHSVVLNAQRNTLNHLLHKNVLLRMSDSALYGNEYSLNSFMNDLTDAVFADDLSDSVNSYRQNLQTDYVNRLIMVSGVKGKSAYDYLSRAAATQQLKNIDKLVKYNKGSGATNVHRNYLQLLIEKAFHGV